MLFKRASNARADQHPPYPAQIWGAYGGALHVGLTAWPHTETSGNPTVRRTPRLSARWERHVAPLWLAAQDDIWLFKPAGVPQP